MKIQFFSLIAMCFLLNMFASDIKILSGLTFEEMVVPGESLKGEILVYNSSDEENMIKTKMVDYFFYADGRNEYKEIGENKRSNANWIDITPKQFKIPPKAKAKINFEIKIPENDDLMGSYWSMLLIEPQKTIQKTEAQNEVGLDVVFRYGYQFITSLKDSDADIKILQKKICREDGKTYLVVDVENIGDVKITPKLWMDVFDDDGQQMGHFEQDAVRIFPTCSSRYHLDISNLKQGNYQALVVFDDDDHFAFGSEYQLEISE